MKLRQTIRLVRPAFSRPTLSMPARGGPSAGLACACTFALILGACGGSDDTATDDASNTSAEQGSEPETGSTTEGGENDGDEADGSSVLASIPWTAPEGMDPVTIAISPSGDQVVIGFAPPFATGALNAEIIVFDVASSTEAWRSSIDDAGDFGLGGLMFTSAGVSFYKVGLDGSQIVTLTDGEASVGDVDFDCAQFLNGTVDPTANVAFTVVPDGFCRVDLTTGAAIQVSAGDLLEGAVGANGSIQYDDGGSLVATVMNADGVMAPLTVDPATLAFIGPGATEPASIGTVYKDRLVEGPVLSSGNRVAGTPNRSTIALLQPDTIELVN